MTKNWVFLSLVFLLMNCSSKEEDLYKPVAYNLEIPLLFSQKLIAPIIPANNPLTQEGVALGKKLFFEKLLSGDNSQSCASCHNPQNAFSDSNQFSNGIDGKKESEMPCLCSI